MQLQNLELLSKVHRDDGHRRYCCRATDAWYHCVHGIAAAWSDAQGVEADAAFQQMMTAEAAPVETPAASTTTAADALRRVLKVADVTSTTNSREFPGPMCSPLCKRDIPQIRQHTYTVTEKSDGVRVVVVALWVADFPQWACAKGAWNVSHLSSVMALEKARRDVRAGMHDTETPSSSGVSVMLQGRRVTLQSATTSVEASEPAETYTIVAEGEAFAARRRCGGRHFAYAVDRSMDAAYLFLDDHTSAQYRNFVLDGELMCVRGSTLAKKEEGGDSSAAGATGARLLLGAFDLFCFTPAGEEEAAKLVDATMMERYELLQKLIATCAASPSLNEEHGGFLEGHVTWYAKTMWRVADIGACLSRLRYSSEHHCFLFDGPHGPTENDGLIFTPDLFPISVGSSSVQLKWKWRHLLSIDWLLLASDKQADVYTVSLFFMKKNYGHREDVIGHWRLRRPMYIRNPRGFEMPVDAAVVAECAYDFAHQQWYIQRLRPDKRGANSIVTAISVYESLVENVSLPKLLRLLQGEADDDAEEKGDAARVAVALEDAVLADVSAVTPSSNSVTAAGPPIVDLAQAEKCVTAAVTLRAIRESRGNTEIYLNAFTNNTNKAVKFPLPFPLRRISDCVGLGYDPATAAASVPSLAEALYIQLGNAGGCYAWSDFVVDAFYNGETGYWELIHLNPRGNNKDALFDNVIEHLDWLLHHGDSAALAPLLQRRRDKPLVVAAVPTSEATQQTSRHYGAVAKELAHAERSDLRRFNNWVKSLLITAGAAAVRTTLKDPAKLHALDLCCGRGGDLLKWQHLHPAFVFMTDASVECVAEAAARYSTSEGQSIKSSNAQRRGFPAFFAVHDAFDATSGLRGDLLKRGPFQLTSCQFSMHYGCRSAEGIRYFVRAVADSLVARGRFVGTTVSDAELLARARTHGASYGNDVYRVHFPAEAFAQVQAADFEPSRLTFGVPYSTTVERSVQDVVEYVVPWKSFVELCAAHHLQLVQEDNFMHFYEQHKETPEGKVLLAEMRRKRGHDGEATAIPLSSEEVEAVQLYRLFVFEKTA
ncbi:methyltransferase putativemRNA cap methyltransferase-like protein [Leptomonas pyrrhocoris]|uniref:mRNA (guanine-N(7))-methyltransferase n=1 Tax=Leptomonas pyrrhocoris TaxID=157538 RepID=A0A0M9G4H3_LEPPY|nr:methyltransferase putativemRNA cap methyltransferase-like protein [Leptomonas pyrrhocoris]XP_015660387.1 methyltransferase putativemRNA cap methyltransferase-like protein [Leptomonas pyrrhocoris]XP_015660388.1 methyltransferase putativemRNA cap methyltransferase-like protein [Leptomonas pyrrhocoris]XP_015660389.1 methyltransferase putativemRNA cap methyltransferase-like protein [Leptomonas pyrrhocoris]XP_015664028.1 methyltransferase putativemRNA cap methyltransferase-like protein [Leptomona|eukprot:XP_015659169.1 methyltransferase putativemRNA cap methyltransferase-like protein [Leptomonas pyrrhocoris]